MIVERKEEKENEHKFREPIWRGKMRWTREIKDRRMVGFFFCVASWTVGGASPSHEWAYAFIPYLCFFLLFICFIRYFIS